MSYRFRIIIVLAVISGWLIVFLSAAGCGGTVTTSLPTPSTTPGSDRFSNLLRQMPASFKKTNLYFQVIDYASFRQDFNVSLTDASGQPLTQMDYVNAMTAPEGTADGIAGQLIGAGSLITGNGRYAATVDDSPYLGYGPTNIDAEIRWFAPPYRMISAKGHFDLTKINTALANQDAWPASVKEAYTTLNYRNLTIHSWGDGLKLNLLTKLGPPHVDELGRAQPLAFSQDYLFHASGLEEIKFMLDSNQNKVDSMADLSDYTLVSQGLSRLGAYIAIMGDVSVINTGSGEVKEMGIETRLKLKRFTTFGTGLGKDEKGLYLALVLIHGSSADANQNATILKQHLETNTAGCFGKPWREVVTNADIRTDKNVLLAKLYSQSAMLWSITVFEQTGLLDSE
jgi:hypothetical protein